MIVALLFGLLYAGHFALVEMRIRGSVAVSLHFGDAVELSGWNLGGRSSRLLHRLRVMASSINASEHSNLVLQVGERRLRFSGATTGDVLALGATPTPDGANYFRLVLGPDSSGGHLLQFQFASGALDTVVVNVSEADAATGVPLISVLSAGSPGKLDLPCSQEEAVAFFGKPDRRVYESRGGSVTVSDK